MNYRMMWFYYNPRRMILIFLCKRGFHLRHDDQGRCWYCANMTILTIDQLNEQYGRTKKN